MADVLKSFFFGTSYNTELIALVLLSSLVTSVLAYECNQNCAQHCNKPDCASEHRQLSLTTSIILLVLNVVLILYYIFQLIKQAKIDQKEQKLYDNKIVMLIKFALPIHAVIVGALALGCVDQCGDSKGCKTKAWKDYVKAVASINIIIGIFSGVRLWYNLFKPSNFSKGDVVSGKFDVKKEQYAITQEAVDNLKKFWDDVAKQADANLPNQQWKSL